MRERGWVRHEIIDFCSRLVHRRNDYMDNIQKRQKIVCTCGLLPFSGNML